MDLKLKRSYSVLLVSSSEKMNQTFAGLLPKSRYDEIVQAGDSMAARRYLVERSFDIVVINAPLADASDESGFELALDIVNKTASGALLFVKAENYPAAYSKVAPYGVLVISKPTTSSAILTAMTLLCGTRERLRRMEKRAESLEERMSQIRVVNQAKLVLIERDHMTEAQAHRYLEKQAMDHGVSKRTIAENVLSADR
ncbi:MAG TPA: antitermination regulator [Lachnospiraceae bacterium]|jgi:AmiR/NasT family two-component response regulator|nr:antitermination regulator [Lachnospiraceae bacterium]